LLSLVEPSTPDSSDRTTPAFTEKSFNIDRWTVEPSDIASNYPILYTFTDSSDNALPSWLEIDESSSDYITIKMDVTSTDDVGTFTLKYSATSTSSTTGISYTDDMTLTLTISDPCSSSNSLEPDSSQLIALGSLTEIVIAIEATYSMQFYWLNDVFNKNYNALSSSSNVSPSVCGS